MKLDGEKIYLREIEISDTENILRWRNHEEVRRYFINQDSFTIESHTAWIKKYVETGKAVQFIIIDRLKNRSIGSVYLRDIDQDQKIAEFGIFIGEADYRGAGYGTEASKMILQYGFTHLQLNNIFLRVLANNVRAIKSYKKVGFQLNTSMNQANSMDRIESEIIFMTTGKEEFLSGSGYNDKI